MPNAYIAHRSKGRVRLRLPDEKGNEPLLAELVRKLRDTPGVRAIETRALTGSILFEHEGELEPIFTRVREAQLFELREPPPEPPSTLAQIAAGFEEAESNLRVKMGDGGDLSALAFYGLLAAGAYQLSRGKLFPAAETLFAHAIAILRARTERP